MRLDGGMMAMAMAALLSGSAGVVGEVQGQDARWKSGPLADPNFFPLAVWCQAPDKAPQYQAIGINVYLALWDGPTAKQMEPLRQAGMYVICAQNDYAKQNLLREKLVLGWMHGDEPDNARPLDKYWNNDVAKVEAAWPQLKGDPGIKWGVPIPPKEIQDDYAKIKAVDPTRPVLLNLGCGVISKKYLGRGSRTNKLEDYPEYLKGCDIGSFDIYPACSAKELDELWLVPDGVERLLDWTGRKKPVWTCIETTQIQHPTKKVTPVQLRAEVWMAIIRGASGIIYFCHTWKPKFREAGLLDDPAIVAAVKSVNAEVTALAPAINSPFLKGGVTVTPESAEIPLDATVRKHGGATYVFAVNLRGQATRGTFAVKSMSGATKAEVIGENRTVDAQGGKFADEFTPWGVHLYKFAP